MVHSPSGMDLECKIMRGLSYKASCLSSVSQYYTSLQNCWSTLFRLPSLSNYLVLKTGSEVNSIPKDIEIRPTKIWNVNIIWWFPKAHHQSYQFFSVLKKIFANSNSQSFQPSEAGDFCVVWKCHNNTRPILTLIKFVKSKISNPSGENRWHADTKR